MNNREIIEQYIPMVEFIATIMGGNCEVVLHDLNTPENSIIAIKNGHLSERKLGGPLTDFALKVLHDKSYSREDFIANYKATAKFKTFRSSSYFIKNSDEEIIGMLCVNVDIEEYVKVKEIMEKLSFISSDPEKCTCERADGAEEVQAVEQLYSNAEDVLNTMIEEVIREDGVAPQRMSPEEKMELVKRLSNKGVFHLKGAVSEVAKALDVSDPTIYRYLRHLK